MNDLQVEGELWKVHRHHFIRESSVFQSMFLLPQGEENPQGEIDQEPITLPGVSKAEMEILLDYFYEGCVGHEAVVTLLSKLIITRFLDQDSSNISSASQHGVRPHSRALNHHPTKFRWSKSNTS